MRSRFTRTIVAAESSAYLKRERGGAGSEGTMVRAMEIPLRDTGGDGPVVLFLHGLLVDGSLWDAVVERLPDHRCLVPELPLGSHTTPFADRSRLTMEG